MQSNADIYLSQLNKSNHLKSSIRQTLKVLSLAVVLVVFWGLKLTGITLAGEAFCGMEEHTHGEECPIQTLICTQEEVEPHIHTEACIHRELICETAECDPHTHSFACKSATLVCTTEETEGHAHSESCQVKTLVCTTEETPGHLHSPQCYGQVLTCTTEEIPAHSHDDACYCVDFTCGQEESPSHSHGDGCYHTDITCGYKEVAPHSHGSGCMTSTLVCTLAEDDTHTHTAECFTETLSCDLKESEGHTHSDTCKTVSLVCSQEEIKGHTHSDACKTLTLVCTLEEVEGHTHENICYTEQLMCTLEEHPEHIHNDGCYSIEPGYGCGLEEIEPHTHSEECYTIEEGVFLCGLEETEGHTHEDTCWQAGIVFGCGMLEADGHIHTAECIVEEPQLGCGKEATEGHIHGDGCYDILESCPLEEHTHVASCYSDINADLETSDDWEMSLAGLTRSSSTAENIITVASSQLGCSESIRNFQVDEFDVRRGITRYGQWYGNPYGDWSAMFASFCLYYAGVDELPINAGPESMRLEWEEEGLYRPAADYAPVRGHILFLDKNANGAADAVAVITEFENNIIYTIEGDISTEVEIDLPSGENTEEETASRQSVTVDMVAETSYPVEDPAILGYGLVPFEPELMILPADKAIIAKTTSYNTGLFINTNHFVVYTVSGGNYYAFDGTGNAVPIYIDAQGNISTDLVDTDLLLWSIVPSGGTNSYMIQNKSSGRYMHAYSNAGGSAVTTTGAYPSTMTTSGSGVRIQGNGGYAQLNTNTGSFQMTSALNYGAVFQFGITSNCTVWLDGTNGGIMALGGSPNTSFTVPYGGTMVLPEQWQSPDKYSYSLCGWYDVINSKYYQPGEEITVTDYMVFYADWAASTYNVGQYNAQVVDTVSTNDFVTTRMFDYGVLFNVLSSRADVTVSSTGHSEVWNLLRSGTNPYNKEETLNFIFRDWDRGNEDISYPANYNNQNHYTGDGVYYGLYSSRLRDILFNPSTQVIGKHYLGTGDHLFQMMTDTSHPYHGYYYYDSELNAASYNQSAGRFYVYDYLSRTSDSASASGTGKYSDFLPLNSPYANTNGNTLRTYSYNGESGEYAGTTHYMYDAKYNTGNDTADYVGTNYYFGMSIDIDFYLPNSPGYVDSTGSSGNRDLYGKEMHFHFSGDDDVWILVDGQVVLDIGGIHGIESGDINFSTGMVTQNGVQSGSITNLGAGDHKLTILYLERGSSQSNCAIYFNLAPRFSFRIQKEDILTQEVLNGAQFSVYLDRACTQPADLWTSKASHSRGDPATNVFTVTNGVANMWGMGAGNTYYIKETKPPDKEEYTYSHGIISVTIDKQGLASYNVMLLDEVNPDGTTTDVSGGFTVHGFRIDEESQQAYIIATNAPEWAREVTSVYVQKRWNDSLNHDSSPVTVYLTVTDPDGTVRQIRETQLGKENGWAYTWENLPKYDQNGDPVVYGVQEVSIPGYMGTVEKIDPPVSDGSGSDTGTGGVTNAGSFENGQTYLLSTKFGYVAAADNKLQLIGTEAEALASNTAQWVATVNGDSTVVLVNKAGQTLYYSNYAFRASSTPESTKNLHFFDGLLSCTIQHSGWSETQYPVDNSNVPNNITYNSVLYTTNNSADALIFTPQKLGTSEPEIPNPPEVSSDDLAYRITNTPLESETSVTVQKAWDYGSIAPTGEHEQAQVTVKLMANGLFTGRTVTLSLKNNWKATFHGLPYKDSAGNVIRYTVEENWKTEDWIPYYGDIITSSGDPPTYSTTITNVYRWGVGEELPSTGTAARMLYMLCGSSLMLLSLVLGIGSRRKRERRPE